MEPVSLGPTMGAVVVLADAAPSRVYDAQFRVTDTVTIRLDFEEGTVGIEHTKKAAKKARAWHAPRSGSFTLTRAQAKALAVVILKAAEDW